MAIETAGQSGCTRDITLLPNPQPVDAGGVSAADSAGVRDTAPPQPGDGPRGTDVRPTDAAAEASGGASCSGLGNPIMLPTSTGNVCAAALATRAYRFALCTCGSFATLQPLKTDVFDSNSGTIGGTPSAGIGVNRDMKPTDKVTVAGPVYVAGAGGLTTSAQLQTAASLRVAGSINTASTHTATDAYIGGNVSGTLIVDGTLHIPANSTLSSGTLIGWGTLALESVSVPQPCNCDDAFVNIAGAITSAERRNDNHVSALSPDRLNSVSTSTVVDIPCGQYFLSGIDATETVFLAVHGRALLAVKGDVILRAGLTVMLDPGAELDLLIGGLFQSTGGNPLGAESPARFRIWVAGSNLVSFDDSPGIRAMIYAPRSPVTANGAIDLSGGMLSLTALVSGAMNLHFDQAIFSSGASCGEPTATPVP